MPDGCIWHMGTDGMLLEILDVLQQAVGNPEPAPPPADLDIRLIRPVEIRTAGWEEAILPCQEGKLLALSGVVGGMVNLQSGKPKLL